MKVHKRETMAIDEGTNIFQRHLYRSIEEFIPSKFVPYCREKIEEEIFSN